LVQASEPLQSSAEPTVHAFSLAVHFALDLACLARLAVHSFEAAKQTPLSDAVHLPRPVHSSLCLHFACGSQPPSANKSPAAAKERPESLSSLHAALSSLV
jgi:hypothetical protein